MRGSPQPFRRFASTAVLTTAALLCIASGATAQSQSDIQAARAHFKTARQLEDQKNWEGASSELRAALAIKETPGLRYHLAYCQEQVGRFSAALRNYKRAKQLLAEGQQAADVSPLLAPAIQRVEAWVAELTFVMVGDSRPKVFLDGNAVDIAKPVAVDPGLHQIRVLHGDQEQALEVSVKAGEKRRIELGPTEKSEPEPVAAPEPPRDVAPAPAAPAPSSQTSLKVPVLIGEGVVALAGLGLGIGFTLQANKAGDEADQALADINQKDPQRQCSSDSAAVQSACSQLADFKQQELDARDIATAGFITAGVGAAALIATWIFWPSSSQRDQAAVHVWAQALPHQTSLGVFGRF
ncbi:MAG: hypothetical protein H6718_11405 [Polyangiaceae bacterium]|nr:hypothetical protein [Polyangiaceae bacterium]